MLMRACDLRLPASLSEEQVNEITSAILASVEKIMVSKAA